MIYDCFLFYNELEILDIRLNTLSSVVDKFVLCESTVDHANKPKPLYFAENKEKYKKFKDKIIYIKVTDTPKTSVPWITIDHQWNAIAKALKKCKPNDTILFSDVDEIPNPEKILKWKDKYKDKIRMCMQSLSYYYLNCVDYADEVWEGTRILSYKETKKHRMYVNKFLRPDVRISDAGWHFSYMGGLKRIQMKVSSTGHQEFNTDQYKTPENIKLAIAEGRDFLNHGLKFKIVDPSFLPQYVQQNKEKFKDFLIDKFKKESLTYRFEKPILQIKYKLRLIYRKLRSIYNKEKDFFQRI